MCTTQHPDGKRKLEVRIRDGDTFVEDTFHRFLRPRTIGVLTSHDETHCSFNGFRFRIASIYEGHGRPAGLHNLGLLMFYPGARLAGLVTLTPSAVCSLMAQKEFARLPRVLTCLIGFPNQSKTFARELCSVRETDSPRTDPTALRRLRFVEIVDGAVNDASGSNIDE